MSRCYGVSMEEFITLGLGWFVNTSHIEYKRPLRLGDMFRVRTAVGIEVRRTTKRYRGAARRDVPESIADLQVVIALILYCGIGDR